MKPTMNITRIYTGTDGVTHFEDREVSLESSGEIGRLSSPESATGIIFRETPGDYDYSWHPAPRRQYVFMLDGEVDIEVGDGARRRFRTGDILLLEDTNGRGHKSRAVDGKSRKSIFVTLD
jgi:uncharacterized cupin superfamily protein